ncbi:hypothetical protein JCM8097_006431 [Rhodosporidiobolus ruineniae]
MSASTPDDPYNPDWAAGVMDALRDEGWPDDALAQAEGMLSGAMEAWEGRTSLGEAASSATASIPTSPTATSTSGASGPSSSSSTGLSSSPSPISAHDASPSASSSPSPSSSTGISPSKIGAIVGAVLGAALLAFLAILLIRYWGKREKKRYASLEEGEKGEAGGAGEEEEKGNGISAPYSPQADEDDKEDLDAAQTTRHGYGAVPSGEADLCDADTASDRSLLRAAAGYTQSAPTSRLSARSVPIATGHNASIPIVGLEPPTPVSSVAGTSSTSPVERAERRSLFDGAAENPFARPGEESSDGEQGERGMEGGFGAARQGRAAKWAAAASAAAQENPFFGGRAPRG